MSYQRIGLDQVPAAITIANGDGIATGQFVGAELHAASFVVDAASAPESFDQERLNVLTLCSVGLHGARLADTLDVDLSRTTRHGDEIREALGATTIAGAINEAFARGIFAVKDPLPAFVPDIDGRQEMILECLVGGVSIPATRRRLGLTDTMHHRLVRNMFSKLPEPSTLETFVTARNLQGKPISVAA